MIKKPFLTAILEGKTSLYVYTKKNGSTRGPGIKQGFPFYNPAMALNRDISILVLQYLIDKKKTCKVLDGMAASGIRGFRFINEVEGDIQVTINDMAEESFQLMKKNAQKNDKKNITLSKENIHTVLSKNTYDYIDVDPFGSPAIFIDSALRSLPNNGILGVTATDTATLCGVYPNVCKRRYNALPLHGPCMHEIALRILIGFIGRQAGKYDKGIEPLFCYSTDHYLRCYLSIKKGVKHADQTIDTIYQIFPSQIPGHLDKKNLFGPLWMGVLHDKQVVSICEQLLLKKQLQQEKQVTGLLSLIEQESLMPAFYFSTTTLSKQFKKSPPRLDHMIYKIQKQRFHITKTQFDPTGFKTTAPSDIVEEIFLDLSS